MGDWRCQTWVLGGAIIWCLEAQDRAAWISNTWVHGGARRAAWRRKTWVIGGAIRG